VVTVHSTLSSITLQAAVIRMSARLRVYLVHGHRNMVRRAAALGCRPASFVTAPVKAAKIQDEGLALWKEGNEAYKAADYKTAIEKFEKSRIKYATIKHDDDVKIIIVSLKAAACEDHMRSNDISKLQVLIGTNEDKTLGAKTPYPEACLPFPELAATVTERIRLLKKSGK